MTTFEKRKEGFERKFTFEQERKFRAEARRNKLLGLWAGRKAGVHRRRRVGLCQGRGSQPISRKRVMANVVRKVLADLRAKDAAITEQAIRAKMNDLAAQALAEVKAER